MIQQQRAVPAPFLTKTYQMVNDPSSDDVISWGEGGLTFVVWKTAEFAKDLLPSSFKHNNFSSFVRQLNTYGFRKIVPDKWEFSNEHFQRGKPELLTGIRRRKNINMSSTAAGKLTASGGGGQSRSNSGEDLGSASTSSSDSKKQGPAEEIQLAELSNENKKLKRDNEALSSELAQAKKQWDELVAYLNENSNVESDQINCILEKGTCGSSSDEGLVGGDKDNDENLGVENEKCLKLFGVLLKEKKRCGNEQKIVGNGAQTKKIKGVWWQQQRKVCN